MLFKERPMVTKCPWKISYSGQHNVDNQGFTQSKFMVYNKILRSVNNALCRKHNWSMIIRIVARSMQKAPRIKEILNFL